MGVVAVDLLFQKRTSCFVSLGLRPNLVIPETSDEQFEKVIRVLSRTFSARCYGHSICLDSRAIGVINRNEDLILSFADLDLEGCVGCQRQIRSVPDREFERKTG